MAIKKNNSNKPVKEKVLLVDARNLFYICYMGSKNNHFYKKENLNGIYFFFLKIKKIIEETNPNIIYYIFDGISSGALRSQIDPFYKLNRRISIEGLNIQDNNKEYIPNHFTVQENLLKEILKSSGMNLICEDIIETDDVIALYVLKNKNKNIIIVSSDSDFYTLINNNVSVYSLKKKNNKNYTITIDNYKNFLNFDPRNTGIIKSITGDASDNISGVAGAGVKTILKQIDMSEEKSFEIVLNEIKEISKNNKLLNKKSPKWIDNCILCIEDIMQNYKIINLKKPLLREKQNYEDIFTPLQEKYSKFKLDSELIKTGLKRLLIQNNVNYTKFLNVFK